MGQLPRPCYGGPHDGRPATRSPEAFRWIDGTGRAWAKPGRGRALYRNDGDRWSFAGHGAGQCGGCGAYLDALPGGAPVEQCPLCGAASPV